MPGRTPRQVRERYAHYLSPDLNLAAWTPEEDALLREKFDVYGPQWSILKSFFGNRSAANVKNHWTTLISRESRRAWELRAIQSKATPQQPHGAFADAGDESEIECEVPGESLFDRMVEDPFVSCVW
jgi:hypothetical protein